MTDRDQPGEDVDEELLDGEYPPEEPLAAEDRGVTAVEELGGESVEEREERREPEPRERAVAGEPPRSRTFEEGTPGEEVAEGLVPVDEMVGTGWYAPDDELTGDETTRDIAPERDPEPAEEAAMHTEPEEPGEPE